MKTPLNPGKKVVEEKGIEPSTFALRMLPRPSITAKSIAYERAKRHVKAQLCHSIARNEHTPSGIFKEWREWGFEGVPGSVSRTQFRETPNAVRDSINQTREGVSMAYSILTIHTQADWQILFDQTEFPQMTQAWAFGEAKRATDWKPQRVAILYDGKPVAICQLLQKCIAGIPLVTRINQGPLILKGYADCFLEAHTAIRRRWRFLLRGALLISPALPLTDGAVAGLKSMGFRQRGHGWASSRLDLTRSIEDLRKGLESTWRNRLKKSESQGLRYLVGNEYNSVQWLLTKHVENMAQKDFDGPSAILVRRLYDASPDDFLVFRVLHGTETIAGMGVFMFGGVGQYYIGWFGEAGRPLSAGNFLLWNVAMELKRRGCTKFDLGGHHRAVGFGKFKMGMNGEPYQSAGEFLCV